MSNSVQSASGGETGVVRLHARQLVTPLDVWCRLDRARRAAPTGGPQVFVARGRADAETPSAEHEPPPGNPRLCPACSVGGLPELWPSTGRSAEGQFRIPWAHRAQLHRRLRADRAGA
jgi:hypothetical protein